MKIFEKAGALWRLRLREAGLAQAFDRLSHESQMATVRTVGTHPVGRFHVPGTPVPVRQLYAAANDFDALCRARSGKFVAAPSFGDEPDFVVPDDAWIAVCASRVVAALTSPPRDDSVEFERFYREYPGTPMRVYDPTAEDVYPNTRTIWPGHYLWGRASADVVALHCSHAARVQALAVR